MEQTQVTLAGRAITLTIRRHGRARRISLRLSAARDGIVMTLPHRASVASGMEFLGSKSEWVLQNLDASPATLLTDGAVIPVLGREVTIRRAEGRGLTQLTPEESRLLVYGDGAFTRRRVRDFLKKLLLEECVRLAGAAAAKLGRAPREIRIRDTRSRWGSCSAQGALTFNWRLVFAPREVLEYLVCHEAAHLSEMNHGPQFWALVEKLCPGHKAARAWLKKQGHALHRYG